MAFLLSKGCKEHFKYGCVYHSLQFERSFLNFIDKAKIRLENWVAHNEQHNKEYEICADQLETAGKMKAHGMFGK